MQTNSIIPTRCPVCSAPLIWEGKHLVCNSGDCLIQTMKKVEHFYSDLGMDVKTIGHKRIWELLQNQELYQRLKAEPWILLDPIEFKILEDIRAIWGQARTNNYLDSLCDIKGKKTIIHFIASFGLDKLAYQTVKRIFYYVKYGKRVRSVSAKAIKSFLLIYARALEIEKKFNNFHFAPIQPPPDKTYCITGTLTQTREDFINWLYTKGWGFIPTVSMTCDYLIIGENPGRVKQELADKYNTTILTEEQVMRRFKK